MLKIFSRIKTFLGSTEGKLKAVILLSGSLILLLALTVGALELTSTPQFCQSCHEMRPEYVTWKASVHSQISCVDCHVKPGAKNMVLHKIESFKQLYDHITGQVYPPITLDTPISNQICEQCHSQNRVVTPPGDIKIPHQIHLQNGVKCVDCHSAVAHANIGEDGFTADGNWAKWTQPVGKAYMKADFLKFSMKQCLDCHKRNGKGPDIHQCSACHKKLVKPASHNIPNFLNGGHGQAALQDINQCNRCHQITLDESEVNVPTTNPTVEYARQNEFCTNCHKTTKPLSHRKDWKLAHSVSALDDQDSCLVCHDESKPKSNSTATQTYCYQCHQPNIHSRLKTNGHPRFPLGNNPQLTKEPCNNCHDLNRCSSCHYIPDTTLELTKIKGVSTNQTMQSQGTDYKGNTPQGGTSAGTVSGNIDELAETGP